MDSAHTGHMKRSTEQPLQMSDLCIVLLGATGAGKSSSGNTIIGEDGGKFKEQLSAGSGTKICRSESTEVNGQKITVIDTVGLFDTSMNAKDLKYNTKQIFDCTDDDSIDVFLLVIKMGNRFTVEEHSNVEWIKENLGTKSSKHTIVLFTHGDLLHEPVEEYLSKYETLRSVVDECSGGYHVFNNKNKDQDQVTELLQKINIVRQKNRSNRYSKKDYEETQKQLRKIYLYPILVGLGAGGIGAAVGAAVGAALVSVHVKIKPDLTVRQVLAGASGGAIVAAAAVAAVIAMKFFGKKKKSVKN